MHGLSFVQCSPEKGSFAQLSQTSLSNYVSRYVLRERQNVLLASLRCSKAPILVSTTVNGSARHVQSEGCFGCVGGKGTTFESTLLEDLRDFMQNPDITLDCQSVMFGGDGYSSLSVGGSIHQQNAPAAVRFCGCCGDRSPQTYPPRPQRDRSATVVFHSVT